MVGTDVRAPERAGSGAGYAGALGGALAIAGNLALTVMPASVPESVLSYPLTSGAYAVWQVFFALTQALMLWAILGLVRSRAAGDGGFARVTGWLAVLGYTLKVPGELVLITVASSAADSDAAAAASTVFGLGVLIGDSALLLHGIAVLRAGRWRTPASVLPLALAATLLLVVTPVSLSLGFASAASIAAVIVADLLMVALGLALARRA